MVNIYKNFNKIRNKFCNHCFEKQGRYKIIQVKYCIYCGIERDKVI